jgi:AcrR family transcriptional regulator
VPARKTTAGRADPATTPARAGTPARNRDLRARGQRTLRKLLDAGITVFARRGYHAARVDDIVKAAKTSHGTFYLYFSSKEDLFQTLVADVADELATLTDSLDTITPDDRGRAALREWLGRFTDMYERYGPIIRTWTEAEIGTNEAGRLGTDVLGELAVALAGAATTTAGAATTTAGAATTTAGAATTTGGAKPTTAGAKSTGRRQIDPAIASLAMVAMVERLNYFVSSGQVDAGRDDMLDTLAGLVHRSLFSPG